MSEEIDYYPEPDAVADVAEPDGSGEAAWAGQPCADIQECVALGGSSCVNRELLDSFDVGEEIDVPGGMCSALFCTSDDACGPQGICFDTSGFSGDPISICLRSCDDIVDCRWEEGYDCFPLDFIEEGLEGGACVSDSIQVAIVCDDGHCDE